MNHSIFYNMINQRAMATMDRKQIKFYIDTGNYHKWVIHWIETAEVIRDEFFGNGLPSSGESMQEVIDDSIQYSQKYLIGTKYEYTSD